MTLRAPLYTRRWEPDPLGIARRSQDGIRANLLETTLRSQDAFLRRPRVDLGRPPDPPRQPDRFWAQNLVLNTLFSPNVYPAGQQSFASPFVGLQPDRSYVQSFAPLLATTGLLPPGRQCYDLPVQLLGYRQAQISFLAYEFIDRFFGAPGQVLNYDWPLPRAPDQFVRGHSWSGQTGTLPSVLAPDSVFRAPLYVRRWEPDPLDASRRQSNWPNLLLSTLGAPPPLPSGRQLYDLPPGPGPWRQAQNSFLAYEFIDQFFGAPGQVLNYDWPLPKTIPDQVRVWTQNLVTTTLAGQGAPLVGQQFFAIPGFGAQSDRFYAQSYSPLLASAATALPPGRQSYGLPIPLSGYRQAQNSFLKFVDQFFGAPGQVLNYDWPLPRTASQFVRQHSWSGQTSTLPSVPFNQYNWTLPKTSAPPVPGWAQNLVTRTLIGQDARLVGRQVFDNAPSGGSQFVRSWVSSAPIVLFSANPVPFSQYDWPNPRAAQRIDEGWIQSLVATTLAGQDARLAGAQLYDLPRTPLPSTRSWSWNVQIQFAIVPQPFAQYDWSIPKTSPQPDRFQSGNFVLSTLLGQDATLAGDQFFIRPELGSHQFIRYVERNLVLSTLGFPGQLGPVWKIAASAPAGVAASASLMTGTDVGNHSRLRSMYLVVSGNVAGSATAVVRDGPPGAGSIIFQADLYTPANGRAVVDFSNIDLRASPGNVLTVEFLGGTPVAYQAANAFGDYVAPGTPYGASSP